MLLHRLVLLAAEHPWHRVETLYCTRLPDRSARRVGRSTIQEYLGFAALVPRLAFAPTPTMTGAARRARHPTTRRDLASLFIARDAWLAWGNSWLDRGIAGGAHATTKSLPAWVAATEPDRAAAAAEATAAAGRTEAAAARPTSTRASRGAARHAKPGGTARRPIGNRARLWPSCRRTYTIGRWLRAAKSGAGTSPSTRPTACNHPARDPTTRTVR